jgi:type II secretory pathway component GspD/PulD (secretin)
MIHTPLPITLFRSVGALFILLVAGTGVQARGQNATTPAIPSPSADPVFVVYEIKHATALDLQNILKQLFPKIKVVLGPQPGFLQKELIGQSLGDTSTTPSPPQAESKFIQDEFVRTLILNGLPDEVRSAEKLLTAIDTAAPQVLIEARIIDATGDFSSQIGVAWDFAPTGTTAQFTLGKPPPKGSPESVIFGRLSRNPIQFNATLDAAIQQNRAKVLASPKLLVIYNHRAQIFIGDEVTYLIGSQATINGANLQTGKVRVGVELNVVATAHPDGTITLRVHPEVGSLTDLTTLGNGVSLPTVSRRFADTEVQIKDGETLVIGGLIGQNESRAMRKVPLLGDIPLLGYLFKHEEKTHSTDELVIFLKATIIKE